MDEETSRGNDNLRGKSAKKKNIADDQSGADDAALPRETSGRIHIFKGKPLPGVSAKSDGQRLQCSSIGAKTPALSRSGDVQAGIVVKVQPPVVSVSFKDELTRFMGRIGKGKKAMYDAAMKAEDLEAIVQTLRRTRNRIFKRRK